MNVLRIGRYRVLQRLGSGASSDVYLSEDSMLKRKVALKVLRRRDADDRQIRCFAREVQCASVLNHPNIITVFDIGRETDLQYIAMEHIDGETLRERIGLGPMTAAEASMLRSPSPARSSPRTKRGSSIATSNRRTS